MALRLVGTNTDVQLACLTNWSQVIPALDLDAIGAAISSDIPFGNLIMGTLRPSAVLATASTGGTTGLISIAANVGSPPISAIRVGDLVLGHAEDITPGSFVTSVIAGGTSVTLSQVTRSTATGVAVAFVRKLDAPGGLGKEAQLWIPGRGMLKVLPGDVVAVDSSGWPILLSANTIGYSGSDWTLT